ncbi:MAG: ABC transporter substrate-binding protein [Eubacteriales bacterium]|nr:ABC transporter substrate-binding protein [Eubacteriales bacterium]
MKKRMAALAMAGCMAFSMIACGQAGAEVTAQPQNEEAAAEEESVPAAEELTAGESSEEQSAADQSNAGDEETALSGKVTVYMPSPAGLADKIAEAFTAKTGVEVEQFQGTTGEILARLEAEASNPVADVVILASWSDGLSMKETGQLMSYAPAEADNIVDGWIDEDSMLFGYSASAVGVIYNTAIYPEVSADWEELADSRYKDDIAIPDGEKSGSCKDFLAGFVTGVENGQDILRSWADNGLTVPGANSAALEAVTTGEKGILIAGVDYNAYSSIDKGEPIAMYYPATGTVVNPRPAMIMNTSPNVENAKAFVDFLFSDEAQALVVDAYLLPGRSDIKSDKRPNLEEIPQIPTDWNLMLNEAMDTAAELNKLCQ